MTIIRQTLYSLCCTLLFYSCCYCQGSNDSVRVYSSSSAAAFPSLQSNGPGPGNNVFAAIEDSHGNIWFSSTGEGVYRYDGNTFTHFTTKEGLSSNSCFAILEDRSGDIWIGTDKGIVHYDGKKFVLIPLAFTAGSYEYPSSMNDQSSSSNGVTCILQDQRGTLWFGTDEGVYCYDGKIFTRFLDSQRVMNSHSLTLRLVNRMAEDSHGNIWFATKLEGVCRFDGTSVVSFTPDDQEWFRGLLVDKHGNVWAGTRYKGVYRYDGNTFTRFMQHGPLDTYTVLAIMQDRSGQIWFGTEAGVVSARTTEGGVWRYDGKTFKNVFTDHGLSRNAVCGLLQDSAGNIWIASRGVGLCRFDGNAVTVFTE